MFNVPVKRTEMGGRKMWFCSDEVYQGNIKFFLSESLSIIIHKTKNLILYRHCEIISIVTVGYL